MALNGGADCAIIDTALKLVHLFRRQVLVKEFRNTGMYLLSGCRQCSRIIGVRETLDHEFLLYRHIQIACIHLRRPRGNGGNSGTAGFLLYDGRGGHFLFGLLCLNLFIGLFDLFLDIDLCLL